MKTSGDNNIELVAFHITQACSHRCPICYATPNKAKPEHPPLVRLKRIVDALSIAKVNEINLLGGDPAGYPYVVDLSKYIYEYKIKVSILSNTFLFPNSSIEEAAKYISSFETTIHHYKPECHDDFCKSPGAYNRLIKQLKEISSHNRTIGIAINILPKTSDKIYKMVDSLVNNESIPLEYVIVQRIIPFGRAANSSEFTLTRKHAEKALYEFEKVNSKLGIEIKVEDPFPLCILPEEMKKYMHPCEWGVSKVSINSKGDVSRCGADNRYRLGNVLVTPLIEIWKNSEILNSFRSKNYLPGRCKVCPEFEICSGGCPLSCEIEKDHGIDYLYLEFEKLDEEIHGQISFSNAKDDELSSMLQIEWSNFPGYGHIFSVESIKKWYKHNPKMFWVVRDSRGWVLGYAVLVPLTNIIFEKIKKGEFSSLNDFPKDGVLKKQKTDYFYIEVIATVPSGSATRVGSFLIRQVGDFLLKHAKYIAASPITEIGVRLCKYFDFKHVADEDLGEVAYPIYTLVIDKKKIEKKLRRF